MIVLNRQANSKVIGLWNSTVVHGIPAIWNPQSSVAILGIPRQLDLREWVLEMITLSDIVLALVISCGFDPQPTLSSLRQRNDLLLRL